MTMERGALKGLDYGNPLVRYRSEKVARLTRILLSSSSAEISSTLAADTYYSLYLPAPIVDEGSPNPICKLVVNSITQTNEGRRLRAKTVLDSLLSAIAAALYLSKLYEKHPGITAKRQTLPTGLEEPLHGNVERLVNEVLSEVEQLSRVRLAIEGLEPGTLSVFSLEDYSLELLKLAREADIRKILEILLGIKYLGSTALRKYRPFKRGEKAGYELGSDVERMSPRNLLYDEDVFYVKLAQGRLLLYSKVIEESMGPIYVLLDKSGSMEGEKIMWAKAVALALYMRALRGRREFYARFFDSQPYDLVKVSRNPKLSEATKVFEYIARIKSAGGTDITRALITAITDLEERKVPGGSIVLITDGIDRVLERPVKDGLKRVRAFLVTVMVKGDNKSLEAISKKYLRVVRLDRDDILKVIEAVGEA